MILDLRYYGDPILRKKAKAIEVITDEIKQLAHDMIETVDAHQGLGLSGNQVGKLLRIFVLREYVEDSQGRWTLSEPEVYINPKILSISDETVEDVEGCLSIPGIREQVKRPLKIIIEAQDLNGELFTKEIEGYNARIRLHENDHINGVLFIDRLDDKKKKMLDPVLRRIKKNYYAKSAT